MTKTLTEQWREGTLPENCYYILTKDGHIRKERTCFYSHTDEQCFSFTSNKDIEEVLAPVPDYDEYRELLDLNIYEKDRKKVMGLEDKIKRLQERLEIATKALKRIDPPNIIFDDYRNSGIDLWEIAHNALKEMEGVK